ncbi:hypothetical protein ACKKBF_B04820 [Auxenochlorella protothecoides x Auxenochlorella symbiontica]
MYALLGVSSSHDCDQECHRFSLARRLSPGASLVAEATRSPSCMPGHRIPGTLLCLALLIAALPLPALAQQAGEDSDEAGMSALIAAWQGLPPSWLQSTPPCSSPNCSSGSGAPACTWQGVACLRGRVVGIALPNSSGEAAAGITGSIPSGITDLTKLQQLDMRGNRISGPLPGFIANLTDLSSLLLAGNQLGGQLPNGLGLMPRLSVLSLAANFFEGGLPASYGNLSTLTVADLSSSGFSGPLPPSWASMSSLQNLDLSSNALAGGLPYSWGSLRSLSQLLLGGNQLTGPLPNAWIMMSSLEVLDVRYNCGICGGVPPFQSSSGVDLMIYSRGSNLGWQCSSSNCRRGSFSLGLVGQVITAILVVLLIVIMCCWRRVILFRRAAATPRESRGWPLVRAVLSARWAPQAALPPSPRMSSVGEPGGAPRLGPVRAAPIKPPIVVVMPDGTTLCTASVVDGPSDAEEDEDGRSRQDKSEEGGALGGAGAGAGAGAVARAGSGAAPAPLPGADPAPLPGAALAGDAWHGSPGALAARQASSLEMAERGARHRHGRRSRRHGRRGVPAIPMFSMEVDDDDSGGEPAVPAPGDLPAVPAPGNLPARPAPADSPAVPTSNALPAGHTGGSLPAADLGGPDRAGAARPASPGP